MRTRTDNSFMPRIGIAQIAIESKTCPSDSGSPLPYFKKCNTTFKPLPKGTYYSRLKGQILKHVYANDERGFDYIELKIPFIVK